MAYSAINRIIHKLFINVNPIVGFFREYFGSFSNVFEGNISGFRFHQMENCCCPS